MHKLNRLTIQRALLLTSAVFSIAACGGGGGAAPVATTALSSTVSSNAVVATTAQNTQIISTQTNATADTQITLAGTGDLSNSLAVGKVLQIPPASDGRYPLGVTGKVTAITTNASGNKVATLAPVTLSDVLSSSQTSSTDIALTSDNFVGVIAPNAIYAGASRGVSKNFLDNSVSALGGQITMSPAKPSVYSIAKASILGGNGTITPNNVDLNITSKPISQLVQDPSRFSAVGLDADSVFKITGALSNLRLTQQHDLSYLPGTGSTLPYRLNSMTLKVKGDVSVEAKLTGNFTANFGYYDQAWNDVETKLFDGFGISGKLTGLDTKDKRGRFPIAGIVFSVDCAKTGTGTCPVVVGQTGQALRQAKDLGVIVWVYLNSNGTVTLNGELGVRTKAGFEIGLELPKDGKLSMFKTLTKPSSGNYIDAPFFKGNASLSSRVGLGIEADVFAFGVRMASAGVDFATQTNLALNALTEVSYSTPGPGEPWAWAGSACLTSNIGGGAIFSVDANVKIDANVWGLDFEPNLPFPYHKQWPSEAQIATSGWSGFPANAALPAINTWYTSQTARICFPKPAVTSVVQTQAGSAVLTLVTFTVTGTNLPSDLSLNLVQPTNCTGLAMNGAPSATLIRYICTLTGGGTSNFQYTLSSLSASNLDTSAVSGSSTYTPNQTITLSTVTDDFGASQGALTNNATTDDTRPTFAGTLSSTLRLGQVLRVYDGSLLLGTASVNGMDWSFTPTSALITGTHTFTLRVANASGQEGDASTPWVVSINTPTTLVCTAPQVAQNGVCVTPTPPTITTAALPDTGITAAQCYGAGSNALVSCTSSAATALNPQQDGMIGRDVTSPSSLDGKAGFSYALVPNTAGGNHALTDCVKDNITGLIWEGKPTSGTRAAANSYTNYDASYGTSAQIAAATNAAAYVTAVNAASLCGFSNWRLPTADELQTIVDYGTTSPAIDANWFPNTQGSYYWSSSPYVANSSYAWLVNFFNGYVSHLSLRSNNYYVRLVRASQ